jgi:HYDIN/CFA65/VesB family protein
MKFARLVVAAAAWLVAMGAGAQTVTNSADSGPNTLREALTNAQADGSGICPSIPAVITFNLPIGDQRIKLQTALPTIDCPGVHIDGSDATGAIGVTIDGSSCPACNGFTITASGVSVSTVAIQSFGGDGINYTTTDSSAALNVFASDIRSTQRYGVFVGGGAATIGNSDGGQNTISGNGTAGVFVASTVTDLRIDGNTITLNGLAAANGGGGVILDNVFNADGIHGFTVSNNFIHDNTGDGVVATGSPIEISSDFAGGIYNNSGKAISRPPDSDPPPVVTAAYFDGTSTHLTATVGAATNYVVEFYEVLRDAPEGFSSLGSPFSSSGVATMLATGRVGFVTATATPTSIVICECFPGPQPTSEFSAALKVADAVTMSFVPAILPTDRTGVLQFSVTNPDAADMTASFNFTVPSFVTVTGATTGAGCGANATPLRDGNFIGVSGATISPLASCVLTVNVAPTATFIGHFTIPAKDPTGAPAFVVTTSVGDFTPAADAVLDIVNPAAMTVAPSILKFGSAVRGTTAQQSFRISNSAAAPAANLHILGAVLNNQSGTGFTRVASATSECPVAPFTLAGGAFCNVTIEFAPTAAQGYAGNFVIDTDLAPVSSVTVVIDGNGVLPTLGISPASVTFPPQTLGTASGTQSVTLTAVDGPIALGTIASSNPEFGVVVGNCAQADLLLGQSCSLLVSFQPTSLGTRTGVITIQDDAAGAPHTISVSGTATAPTGPILAAAPSPLAFALQAIGTPSGVQDIIVTNNGVSSLDITDVVITGADFAGGGCKGQSVAAGSGSCAIGITFTPSAAGARTGAVTITSNAPGSPHTVSLSGTGGSPTLQLSATHVDFSRVQVGTTSAPQTVTLTNAGNTPLHITGITISGDFGYTGCGFPLTLAAGASCDFAITFSPLAPVPLTGVITIASDAPGGPHTITLAGTGNPSALPGIAARPSALGFGNVQVGSQATARILVVSNGAAPLTLLGITIDGPFFAQSNGCPLSMPVGTSCEITVTYSPRAEGVHDGHVSISYDPGFVPLPAVRAVTSVALNVPLRGTAVAVPPAQLAVERLVDFGQLIVGNTARHTLLLRNTGGQALGVSDLRLTGAGFAREGSCGSIPAGGSCELTLVFAPAAVGDFTGRLDIVSSDARGTVSVDLLGQSLAVPRPEIELSVDGIGFSNQMITTQSTSQTVTVTSVGRAPLRILGVEVTGPFVITGNTCAGTLAPEAHCEVTVGFTPAAPGPADGRLTVNSDAAQGRGFTSLTGTGCRFLSVAGMRNLQRLCSP